MIDLIIFSKDRPMQLDATLRSVQTFSNNIFDIKIIYTYTNEEYEYGYRIIEFNWLTKEKVLKNDVLSFMESKYVCFMVDDDIMFTQVPPIPELKKNEVFSLRLGNNVKGHKDYPLALDGHIFRTEDIKPIIEEIEFDNPNDLEKKMQKYKDQFSLLWDYQCLVGIPHNRVSTKSHCKFSGKYTTKQLNDLFLEGNRIDFLNMDFSNIDNVHKEIDYKFVK